MADNPWDPGQGWSGPSHDGTYDGGTPKGPPSGMPVWAWLQFPSGELYEEASQRIYILAHPETLNFEQDPRPADAIDPGTAVAGPFFIRDNDEGTLKLKATLDVERLIGLWTQDIRYAAIGGEDGQFGYFAGFTAADLALVDNPADPSPVIAPYLKAGCVPGAKGINGGKTPTPTPIAPAAPPPGPVAGPTPAPVPDPRLVAAIATNRRYRANIVAKIAAHQGTPADSVELAHIDAKIADYQKRLGAS